MPARLPEQDRPDAASVSGFALCGGMCLCVSLCLSIFEGFDRSPRVRVELEGTGSLRRSQAERAVSRREDEVGEEGGGGGGGGGEVETLDVDACRNVWMRRRRWRRGGAVGRPCLSERLDPRCDRDACDATRMVFEGPDWAGAARDAYWDGVIDKIRYRLPDMSMALCREVVPKNILNAFRGTLDDRVGKGRVELDRKLARWTAESVIGLAGLVAFGADAPPARAHRCVAPHHVQSFAHHE